MWGLYQNYEFLSDHRPHKVREFIIINEPFLKKLIEEKPRTIKRGRKRIAER